MADIKKCWAAYHNTQDQGALTGTGFDYILEYYELRDFLKTGMNVLEIGVGFGLGAKGFRDDGCAVSVMDICEEAFPPVRDIACATYLHENAHELPTGHFDLAISHLVTQHMAEEDILWQFPHVIRSLAPGGRFLVQFAGSDTKRENNVKETIVGHANDGLAGKVSMLGGRMVRTEDYATDLIGECGGRVARVGGIIHYPKYKSYWYWLDVRKNDADA